MSESATNTKLSTITGTAPPVGTGPGVIGPGNSVTVYSTLDPSYASVDTIEPDFLPTSIPTIPTVNKDKRVRISLPAGSKLFYKDPNVSNVNPLLKILTDTDGVIFPFQPDISLEFTANYQMQEVTHSNFAYYSYQNSKITPIQIQGDFIIRTPYEGQYVLASLHFLRLLTLMFTGNDSPNAGAPPIIVRLNGMGFGGLDNIPVVITSVLTHYPDNVDYVTVRIPLADSSQTTYQSQQTNNLIKYETAKVPTLMNISVQLTPVYSRDFAANFSVNNFANGSQRLVGPNF